MRVAHCVHIYFYFLFYFISFYFFSLTFFIYFYAFQYFLLKLQINNKAVGKMAVPMQHQRNTDILKELVYQSNIGREHLENARIRKVVGGCVSIVKMPYINFILEKKSKDNRLSERTLWRWWTDGYYCRIRRPVQNEKETMSFLTKPSQFVSFLY